MTAKSKENIIDILGLIAKLIFISFISVLPMIINTHIPELANVLSIVFATIIAFKLLIAHMWVCLTCTNEDLASFCIAIPQYLFEFASLTILVISTMNFLSLSVTTIKTTFYVMYGIALAVQVYFIYRFIKDFIYYPVLNKKICSKSNAT